MDPIGEVILAAVAFVGSHLVLANAPVRAAIAGRIGEGPFLILFSLVAAATFAWLLIAYGTADYVALWAPPAWSWWLPVVAMPVAFVLAIAGYTTPNPTAIRQEKAAAKANPAPGILTVTRHPLMWAMALWAASHMPANGDAASVVLLGAILVLAVVGMGLQDLKKRRQLGPDWARFAAATSAVPFAAILQGRSRLDLAGIGWWRLALGLALFAFFLAIHPWLIGVPALKG